MSYRNWLTALIGMAGPTLALACVYLEPDELLDDRAASLKAPVANSFAFELNRLSPPVTDRLNSGELPQPGLFGERYIVYRSEADGRDHYGEEALRLRKAEQEASGLSPEQTELLQRLTQADRGDQVIAEGSTLPDAVRLYAAGAVEFHHERLKPAEQFFRDVLALPDERRAARAAVASFMIGRAAAAGGDAAQAVAALRMTRELVQKGAPDQDGVAVASFGEEARIHFRRAKALAASETTLDDEFRRELSASIKLYLEQSAHGSWVGPTSLRIVADFILADRKRTTAALEVPEAQRLLVAVLLAHFGWDIPDPDTKRTDDNRYTVSTLGLLAGDLLDLFTIAAEQHGEGWLADSDQVATLAYREGRYDIVRRLTEKSTGPASAWLKAKLALQRGDSNAATGFYAQAIASLTPAPESSSIDADGRARLIGETGVLALSRTDYQEAMRYLYCAGPAYARETGYVADRVLTVEELKAFVDKASSACAGVAADTLTPTDAEKSKNWLNRLLARRLIRSARYDEAIPYFGNDGLGEVAREYGAQLRAARTRWTAIGRAEAWFRAATIARHSGLELMGSEGAPDFVRYDGDTTRFDPATGDQHSVPPDEVVRVSLSEIKPNERFHYRYIAADEAMKAADELPARSQAFAAVLCAATRWMLSSHADYQVSEIYDRYVHEGAIVPWATHFGSDCPAPDFAGAGASGRRALYLDTRHFLRAHHVAVGSVGALVLMTFGALLWRRRSTRTAAH